MSTDRQPDRQPERQPDRQGDAVHNRIALLRAEQRVTRRELADALGVHYQTVGYIERGEYNPSLALALRIADFFGLPVETVFSITPFPRISDAARPGTGPHGAPAVGE